MKLLGCVDVCALHVSTWACVRCVVCSYGHMCGWTRGPVCACVSCVHMGTWACVWCLLADRVVVSITEDIMNFWDVSEGSVPRES